jgi:CHAT domain-containing protein
VRVDVRTAYAATEAQLKRHAAEYAFVHLATHGLISSEHPLASSLALAPGDGDDGYLRVDEIFGLALHARLVVLSGCSTGLGRLSADGVLGLTRAFIYAGTPAIVVSDWDVSDRATATLMGAFYRAMAGGLDPVHALRRAQIETRRQFAAPGQWAAFVLVGDPR